MPVITWLIAAAWPIARKVLVALGIGIITYGGLNVVGSQINNAIISSWGALGGYTINILSLAGIPDCIGIILGAINARIALAAASKMGVVAAS